MTLWRISNHTNLSGQGGLKAPGRWHHKGQPVVYLAEHPALALLEVLVHLEASPDQMPAHVQFLQVTLDAQASRERLGVEQLPAGWHQQYRWTRAQGDQWLAQRRSLLLEVPSGVAPQSWNTLLNPLHPQVALAAITAVFPYPLDKRLYR